jgi:hypothetical protein
MFVLLINVNSASDQELGDALSVTFAGQMQRRCKLGVN